VSTPDITINLELNQLEAGEFVVGTSLVGGADVIGDGLSEVQSSGVRCSIRRGRWGQLYDDFEAASVSVALNNENRLFDPSYAAGDYFGELLPGRDIKITAGGVTIFTGFVEDYDLEYDVSGRSVTVLKSTDALGRFGALQFDAWTNSGRDAAAKLSNICNRTEVQWASGLRDFIGADVGVPVPLQSDAVSWGSSVFNYMRLIAQSDMLSFLFASADGLLTLRPVFDWLGLNVWTPTTMAAFGGAGIPYQAISARYGSETLYSEVSIDYEGGTAQTAFVADRTAWQSDYGPLRRLSIGGLLLDDSITITTPSYSGTIAEVMAEVLRDHYDAPAFLITEFSVELASLSPANQATVLGIDIADAVDIEFTPNNVGSAISQTLAVQGIAHDITPESHVVTFSVINYEP